MVSNSIFFSHDCLKKSKTLSSPQLPLVSSSQFALTNTNFQGSNHTISSLVWSSKARNAQCDHSCSLPNSYPPFFNASKHFLLGNFVMLSWAWQPVIVTWSRGDYHFKSRLVNQVAPVMRFWMCVFELRPMVGNLIDFVLLDMWKSRTS